MRRNDLNIPIEIMGKLCNELYRAGVGLYTIAERLKVDKKTVESLLDDRRKPKDGMLSPYKYNQQLVDEILYDANIPIAKDAIVAIEKTRYQHYAQLEETCLRIMNNLLLHYEKVPMGDEKIDRFKAQMAANFIKATQSAREEVLKKYEIDRATGQKQDSITVEIVNPKENM